jgi:hypothetical protein
MFSTKIALSPLEHPQNQAIFTKHELRRRFLTDTQASGPFTLKQKGGPGRLAGSCGKLFTTFSPPRKRLLRTGVIDKKTPASPWRKPGFGKGPAFLGDF